MLNRINNQVEQQRNQGIKDAARRANKSSNDSPAQPPHTTLDLPYMGFIHAGTLIEHPMQVSHAIVDYWARRVWLDRYEKGLETTNIMPDNWIGIYVIGALIHQVVTHPTP